MRAFLIHGWEGTPNGDWYPWLKKELEAKGFQVQVPAMPNTEEPKIGEWVPFLQKIVAAPDTQTFFVGHSMGCQAILRYLETLPFNVKIGGAVFVACFFHVTQKALEDAAEQGVLEIVKPWLELPLCWNKIRSRTPHWTAVFSDDDSFVPLSNSQLLKEKLGAKIIIEHAKGHFSEDTGVLELPVVLEELLKMASKKSA